MPRGTGEGRTASARPEDEARFIFIGLLPMCRFVQPTA